jgi:aminomethyltransferase
VYRIADGVFQVVINAANREKDIDWMKSHMSGDVSFEDASDWTVMIAVQGPRAVGIVDMLTEEDLTQVEKFSAVKCNIIGNEVLACRTGYTGEDGFELIVQAGFGEELWDALAAAGVQPCGLAARDVLRVEAGLPLYGHELSDQINPIETGLGWVCDKEKSYIGSEAINAMRAEGPPRKLVGIRMESKIVPREGYEVRQNGERIGEISSGVFSPVLDCGIAFAFVDKEHSALDQPCSVVIREKEMPATVVNKRFLRPS